MKKFILRFIHFNTIYWKKLEERSPRFLTTRSLGKTLMRQAYFETMITNYQSAHKQFLIKYEKIDKWRATHRKKNIL